MESSIYIKELSQKYTNLRNDVVDILESSHNDEMKHYINDIPKKLINENNKINIVFCGQYSAGKSSIIKQMTGDASIGIAEGVTTDKATVYQWDGIEIVDTPGIQTGKHEDHDEITYEYIAKADLLVYVVTNELFDDILGRDFRRLAVENEKANEMLLVVNKMERHQDGNSEVAHKIIEEDIRKVLAPYSPEDLNISFISTDIAMEADSIDSNDEKNEYLIESGYPQYYKNLNTFISQKGMLGKLTTNISTLSHIIQEILSESIDMSPEEEALDALLMEKRRRVRDSSSQAKLECDNAIKQSTHEIRQLGNKASALVENTNNSDEANQQLVILQEQVSEISTNLQKSLENIIEGNIEELEKELKSVGTSEIGQIIFTKLNKIVDPNNTISKDDLDRTVKISDGVKNIATKILKNSFNVGDKKILGIFKMSPYRGTDAHNIVLNVGKKLGYKFKPWEAVNWTKRIANVSRGLAVIGTIVSIGAQMWADKKEDEESQSLLEVKSSLRAGFTDAADVVELEFNKQMNIYEEEIFTSEIDDVDAKLRVLKERQELISTFEKRLYGLLDDSKSLISEIHGKNQVAPHRVVT